MQNVRTSVTCRDTHHIYGSEIMSEAATPREVERHSFIKSVHGVRYQVKDVARAVAFFSSPDADFITGQTLYVCGGASIGSISI